MAVNFIAHLLQEYLNYFTAYTGKTKIFKSAFRSSPIESLLFKANESHLRTEKDALKTEK